MEDRGQQNGQEEIIVLQIQQADGSWKGYDVMSASEFDSVASFSRHSGYLVTRIALYQQVAVLPPGEREKDFLELVNRTHAQQEG